MLNEANFVEACETADIVSIGQSITFDTETAVNLADRFLEDEDYFFLLESAVSGGGQIARYTFIGFGAIWSWKASDTACEYGFGPKNKAEFKCQDHLRILGDQLKRFRFKSLVNGGGISKLDLAALGGAVGYMGYDVAANLEPTIGRPPGKGLDLPTSFFMIPENFIVLDQLSRQLYVHRYCHPTKGQNFQDLFVREKRKLEALTTKLTKPHQPPPLRIEQDPLNLDKFESVYLKQDFLKDSEYCLEQVRAGEVFQVQIGNRLQLQSKARPFDVFRHLRILNPSPYMFFLKMKGHHILGASPEMMVNVHDRLITHRPIAGTRKKTWDPVKDAMMRHELEQSEKERAEHVMLVDLSRNDIGRLSNPGSIRVDELMVVEEYSHVFHLVSQVVGTLSDKFDVFDAMQYSFPNGTVSGAPKVRAMQLIYEIEKVRREYYAGSLALFDFKGNLKSTILIRSMHMKDGVCSTQASAGIVYDSEPELEWLETRNKMAACGVCIQNTL